MKLASEGVDASGKELLFERGIYQVELEHLNRIDRCITCHNGLEDPMMAAVQQPHTLHPGKFLTEHPVQKFGCTICHGGQGRALTKNEVFGLDPEYNWSRPLLYEPYIQASCGRCHLSIFNGHELLEGTDVFKWGQEIFGREGCLGCHKARGVGGILGPDLTEQGEKTKHEYSFQNISGEQTVSNWLKSHFRDPEMVSPGSLMLKIELPDDELDALATFVMGLARPEMPVDYFSLETLNELRGHRKVLNGPDVYSFSCSGCHGKGGEGKDYRDFKTGVPAIMNPDFLRVASGDFILFTLLKGRSLRQMSSWDPEVAGWSQEEIASLVRHLEGTIHSGLLTENITPVTGSVRMGKEFFRSHCQSCHGEGGTGETALAINKKDFLSRTDKDFIIETVLLGRNNSGMPGWPQMEKQETEDLLALLNHWYRIPENDGDPGLPPGKPEEGEFRFHYLCSRCHGTYGEGDTGPAIMDRDFLKAASDQFLYETIAEGRSNTAMFGWSTDVYNEERLNSQEIANIIAYLRSVAVKIPDYIYPGPNRGDLTRGKILFDDRCSECHGLMGEGSDAPALNNQEFLSAATNGYIMATITVGRIHTRMPAWGYPNREYPTLSGDDRQDITAYIRSWQRIQIRF
ncbi:MAG: c-type cytochrome [Bacteroidales bacterium]|nr:c-type cytochrome [Bacteroidales bacterium]